MRSRGAWRREVAAARSLSRATFRSWWNLLRRSTNSSSTGAWAVVIAALLLAVGWNWSIYAFLNRVATPALNQSLPDGQAAAPLLVGALVQGAMVTAALVTLVFVIFVPPRSGLAVSALALGASRRSVAVGQLVPLVTAAVIAGLGGQLAVLTWVVTVVPTTTRITALIASIALMVAAPLAVLAGFTGVQGLVYWLVRSELASRLFGLVGATVPLLALALDVLTASARSQPPHFVDLVWEVGPLLLGEGRLSILARSLGAGVVVLCLAVTSAAINRAAGESAARVVVRVPRVVRSPFIAATGRELVLWIRHPVVQLGLALWLVIAVAALWTAHVNPGFEGPAAIVAISLIALTAETAYGRTRPWHWTYALCGRQSSTWLWPKVVAALLPSAAAAPILALGSMGGVGSLRSNVVGFLALAMLFGASGLLAGTLLPFSDAAPGAMAMTSIISVALGAGALYLESRMPLPDATLLMGQGLLAALFITFTRWRVEALE